jgi:hypothetical protein
MADNSQQLEHRAAGALQQAQLAGLITSAYAPACRLYIYY